MTTRRATPSRRPTGVRPGALPGLLLAALALFGCAPRKKDRLALVGATVIDGSGGAPLPDAVVVVRDGKIEAVEPRASFQIPESAEVVELRGRWIIPGLVDAHAHTPAWALPRYLAYGVTSVRDLHGTMDSVLALRGRTESGSVAGPRMYVAGAMIDGRPATYPDGSAVTNDLEARRAVDIRAVAGVDLVKVYTRITPPLLRAIVDEAGTLHLPVAAHLGLTDAVTAARIGVRSIEHLTGVPEAGAEGAALGAAHRESFFAGWNAFERSWSRADSAALARIAQALAERRTILVPTLVLHETFAHADRPEALRDPDLAAVPDSEVARWNLPDLIRRAGWTAEDFALFRAGRPLQDLFVREFRVAGGTVVAGTDASNQLLVPGASLHRELELLVNAGLTPGNAILAATRNAAELLRADTIGAVRPGAVADLVVLRGNPLADIRNTRRIELVILRGVPHRPDSIRRSW